MASHPAEPLPSFESVDDSISWIRGYETEAEVLDASRQIIVHFGLHTFVFGALSRTGEREHYRYLVGCDPEWCFLYTENKWYAVDPCVDYALKNTSPALASQIPVTTAGQERLMAAAAEHGFRSGIVVPAHSPLSTRIGVLYLGTNEGEEHVRQSYARHRNLMRAFALELLEWWDAWLRDTTLDELDLDELDLELLQKAREQATAEAAAHEIGVTLSRVKARYNKLLSKLHVSSKREAVEKAVLLGLIKAQP